MSKFGNLVKLMSYDRFYYAVGISSMIIIPMAYEYPMLMMIILLASDLRKRPFTSFIARMNIILFFLCIPVLYYKILF